jgi:hypothetical protein
MCTQCIVVYHQNCACMYERERVCVQCICVCVCPIIMTITYWRVYACVLKYVCFHVCMYVYMRVCAPLLRCVCVSHYWCTQRFLACSPMYAWHAGKPLQNRFLRFNACAVQEQKDPMHMHTNTITHTPNTHKNNSWLLKTILLGTREIASELVCAVHDECGCKLAFICIHVYVRWCTCEAHAPVHVCVVLYTSKERRIVHGMGICTCVYAVHGAFWFAATPSKLPIFAATYRILLTALLHVWPNNSQPRKKRRWLTVKMCTNYLEAWIAAMSHRPEKGGMHQAKAPTVLHGDSVQWFWIRWLEKKWTFGRGNDRSTDSSGRGKELQLFKYLVCGPMTSVLKWERKKFM